VVLRWVDGSGCENERLEPRWVRWIIGVLLLLLLLGHSTAEGTIKGREAAVVELQRHRL
jgi:hypothetical protein